MRQPSEQAPVRLCERGKVLGGPGEKRDEKKPKKKHTHNNQHSLYLRRHMRGTLCHGRNLGSAQATLLHTLDGILCIPRLGRYIQYFRLIHTMPMLLPPCPV